MKRTLLAACAALSLLPGVVAAQAYTPTANDTLYVNSPDLGKKTVNAASYIQSQAGAAAAALSANNTWTGTNTFTKAVTISPATGTVAFAPTSLGTINHMTIGGTTPAAVTATTATAATSNVTGAAELGGVVVAQGTETPTATVGGTGSPTATLTANAGSKVIEFTLASATAATNIVVTPGYTAAHGFTCRGWDATTSTERVIQNTAISVTTATLTFFNAAGTATAPGASDVVVVDCDSW